MGVDDEQAESQIGALVPTHQDTVPFYGHELIAVLLPDGRIGAVLRSLADGLGLNLQSQLRHIRGRAALADGLVPVRVETEGGPQTMQALTLDVLPGWLFSVDERRVKPEARPDVILFQRECVKTLADHFARKRHLALPAPQSVAPADPHLAGQVVMLSEQIDTMSGAVTLMREHLAALLALPTQVAGLSEQLSQAVTMLESLGERQDAAEARIAETGAQLAHVDARTQRLSPAHTRQVQEMVDRMVRETKRLSTPLTYAMIYGRLKHRFRVGSYKEADDGRFDELMAYLRDELSQASAGEAPEQGSLF
jgi:hypothetical protein